MTYRKRLNSSNSFRVHTAKDTLLGKTDIPLPLPSFPRYSQNKQTERKNNNVSFQDTYHDSYSQEDIKMEEPEHESEHFENESYHDIDNNHNHNHYYSNSNINSQSYNNNQQNRNFTREGNSKKVSFLSNGTSQKSPSTTPIRSTSSLDDSYNRNSFTNQRQYINSIWENINQILLHLIELGYDRSMLFAAVEEVKKKNFQSLQSTYNRSLTRLSDKRSANLPIEVLDLYQNFVKFYEELKNLLQNERERY